MKLIRNPGVMSELAAGLKKKGRRIGFVPTMGYLHEGHLSLIRRAAKETDVVIVSIFVNPTQFGKGEDYTSYPRDLRADKRAAEKEGAAIIFAPKVEDMYPAGYQTYIESGKLTETLCGASRPGHFRGVTTIVAKLFNLVQPDAAYFGQKDAQQLVVIKKMVRDLDMGIKVIACPIVREKDGLAMSSRNAYLSSQQRCQATALYRSLKEAAFLVSSGQRNSARITGAVRRVINAGISNAVIDYIAVVDKDTLTPLKRVEKTALIALAVRVGRTRLIDNIIVRAKKSKKK